MEVDKPIHPTLVVATVNLITDQITFGILFNIGYVYIDNISSTPLKHF